MKLQEQTKFLLNAVLEHPASKKNGQHANAESLSSGINVFSLESSGDADGVDGVSQGGEFPKQII